MEPATGASTWALGNQRWTPYKGIFTKKAKRQANHHNLLACVKILAGGASCKVIKDSVPIEFCKYRRAIRRGSEPARV